MKEDGADEGIRTPNPQFRRLMLYPLSYVRAGVLNCTIGFAQCAGTKERNQWGSIGDCYSTADFFADQFSIWGKNEQNLKRYLRIFARMPNKSTGMQTDALVQPLLGLDEEFPQELFVLHHPATGKYGCYCYQGVHGLACFSSEPGAFQFAEWIDMSGMVILEMSFDEARDVAKGRPLPVIALMLLDELEDPKIHYVR